MVGLPRGCVGKDRGVCMSRWTGVYRVCGLMGVVMPGGMGRVGTKALEGVRSCYVI